MSASNTLETGILNLIFANLDLANIGDAAGLQNSAAAGSLYIALYTTDPTDADTGTEATYTSYARVAVARSGAGWTVAADNVSNAAAVTFPSATGGTNTITHFGIRTAAAAGDLLFSGALTASLAVSSGITPEIAIGGLDVTVA